MTGFNPCATRWSLGSLRWGNIQPSINKISMINAMSEAGAPAAPNPGRTRYAGTAKSSARNTVNSIGRRPMVAT